VHTLHTRLGYTTQADGVSKAFEPIGHRETVDERGQVLGLGSTYSLPYFTNCPACVDRNFECMPNFKSLTVLEVNGAF